MQREQDETQNGSGPPGVPAWLKISGVVVAVLVAVVIIVLLMGGGNGEHGPARHGAEGAVSPRATVLAMSVGVTG